MLGSPIWPYLSEECYGVTHRFNEDILIIELPQTYSTEELREGFVTSLADPNFTKGVKTLIDASASQVFPTSQDLMKRLSMLLKLSQSIAPDCAVVVSNPTHEKIVHLLSDSMSRQGFNLRAFTDFDLAWKWLVSINTQSAEKHQSQEG